MRKYVRPLARFTISFVIISLVLYLFRDQLPVVLTHLYKADLLSFALAVAVFMAGLIGTAFRLRLVLRVHGAELPVTHLYYMNLIALFFNNILPSHAGGDMVKAYYIYRGARRNVAAFSGVVIDRLFGLVTMVCIGGAAIVVVDRGLASPKIVSSLVLLTAVIGCVFVVLFNKGIVDFLCRVRLPLVPAALLDKLRDIYQAMHLYRGHTTIVTAGLLLTLIGQVAFVFSNYFLARSLAIDIPLEVFFYLVPIILIVGLTPTINGIGVREATYLYYLTGLTTTDKALALSLFTSFFMVFIGMIGGVLYAFIGGRTSINEMMNPET
jgi:uncharacterized protein (TIRG00374 family)